MKFDDLYTEWCFYSYSMKEETIMKKLIALLIVATIIIGCPGFEDMIMTKTAAPEGAGVIIHIMQLNST